MENNQMGYNDAPQGGTGFGVASLVLGILAIVFACCFYYISLPCGILGLIFGALAIKKGGQGKGMGIAGLTMSLIAVLLGVVAVAMGGAIVSELISALS